MPSTRSSLAMLAVVVTACVETPIAPGTGDSTTSTTTTTEATTVVDPTTETTGGPTQTPTCAAYLMCLVEIAPDEVDSAEAEIGEGGSCWQSPATASACDGECSVQLAQRCTGGSSSSETGEPPLTCAIEGLLPGAPNPIDAGDGVGQLPVEIGDVLARNCGCHYVDPEQLDETVPSYSGTIELSTWQQFHNPFMGTPTYQRVRQRAVVELSMPPSFYCDALAFGSLSAEDHALLDAWLSADAPDGSRWP